MNKPTEGGIHDGVFVDAGGRWWRAKAGSTSTFAENVAVRALFVDLHHDQFWNPWRMEDRADDLERAEQVMEEWERAEPGFKRKTKRQFDAEMRRWDRDFARGRAEREQVRQENLKRHDPERDENRLALLEHLAILAHKKNELTCMRSGERSPGMDSHRRSSQVTTLEAEIAEHEAAAAELKPLVGDPEEVVDPNGHLPRDRRISTLYTFGERRIKEVRALRTQIDDFEVSLETTDDKSAKARLRSQRAHAQWQLDRWLAIPHLKAEQMCADCDTPEHKHGYVTPPYDGPCPAWPRQRAIRAKVIEILETSARQREDSQPATPKPKPLAVVPSGLPIAEVVARLQELQVEFPEAEVRRGRANRWELWPSVPLEET